MSDWIPLAMTAYSSWIERLFSADGLKDLLFLSMGATAIMVPVLARRRSAESPYFSGVFALALCPFFFGAIIALQGIHSLIEHEDFASTSYVLDRLRFLRQVFVFGAAFSAFALVIYSAIRTLIRRRTNHQPRLK